MVIDLSRQHSGFIDGLRYRRGLIALPLAPETGPEQRGEWRHGGDHQGQKTRSNAAQHLLPPANRFCLPSKRPVLGAAAQIRKSTGSPQLLSESFFRASCEG